MNVPPTPRPEAPPPSGQLPSRPSASKSPRSAPGRWAALGISVAAVALVGAIAVGGSLLPSGSVDPVAVAAASGPASTRSEPAPSAPSQSSLASLAPGSAVPSAVAPSASAPSPADPAMVLRARLQATLDRTRLRLAIPGVSVTILLPDGSSWTGVSGFANVAKKRAVTADTAFAFASMSKTMTSAVVLGLIEEGRLSLADSAASRLPAGLPIRLNPAITIQMLLDHTSGLADYFLNRKIDARLLRVPTKAWGPADALRFVGKTLSPPGRAFHYSNTNYLLLGLIAEQATGTTLDKLVRTRLLGPLGLEDTWYQSRETPRTTIADGYRVTSARSTVRPADLADGSGIAPFRSVVTAAGGAGSIAGTSADLARWAHALYGGQVLGQAGTRMLLGDFTRTTGYIPGAWYGLGVQSLLIDGHRTYGHSGRLLGFRGAVRDFPDDRLTIAVLTNQSRADPAVILRALERIVLPPPPKPTPTAPSPSAASSTPSASAG